MGQILPIVWEAPPLEGISLEALRVELELWVEAEESVSWVVMSSLEHLEMGR